MKRHSANPRGTLRRRAILAACAALLFASGRAALGQAALSRDVAIATSEPGTIYHASSVVIAKLLSQRSDIRATIRPYMSPRVSIPAVSSGDIQFGLDDAAELGSAFEGKEQFSGKPQGMLRAIAVAYPLRPAIFVRQRSAISTIADLKGRSVPDGFAGEKTVLMLLDALYATAGLGRADVKSVPVSDMAAGADAFVAGKVDMFPFALGSSKLREVDAAVGGIRMLSIAETPANLAAVRRHFPAGYLRLERPGPSSVGVLAPGYTLAYDVLIFTGAGLPDDVAYTTARILHDGAVALGDAFEQFRSFDPRTMGREAGPLPYHPGAIRFYREAGIWKDR